MEMIMNQSTSNSNNLVKNTDKILIESGFYWREKNGVNLLVCKELEDVGFANGFSTRLGGVSPFPKNDLNLSGFDEDSDENIFENRRRFLDIFDGEYSFTSVWQVHGDGVKLVKTTEDVLNTEEKFDGMVSGLSKILVGVKTADCVPVLIGDPIKQVFSAIHAGWRGTVESIVQKAIGKMQDEFGSNAKDLVCAIGPAAGCKNYEIGRDVIDAFSAKFSTCGKFFEKTREGHALIDLHLANKEQLIETGVLVEKIFTAPFCTIDRTDLFFSYRVEKKKYGKTGRLMSVIGLNS